MTGNRAARATSTNKRAPTITLRGTSDGPYADLIVAEFDPNNRVKIVRIFPRKAQHEGHDDEVSGEDGWIFFW